jgi:hypothetical protein
MKNLPLIVGILLSISIASFAQTSKKKTKKFKKTPHKTEIKSDSLKKDKKENWEKKERSERKERPDSLRLNQKAKNPNWKNGKERSDSMRIEKGDRGRMMDSTKTKEGHHYHHNHQH